MIRQVKRAPVGRRPRFKLQRENLESLYVQIERRLERDIASGRYAPFARLPSEHELMEEFGVSRITVRQATAALLERGLIEVKQGKGAFVAGPIVRHGLDSLTGFYDALVAQGLQPSTTLLEFGAASSIDHARTVFAKRSGEAPVSLKRLYLAHNKPIAVVYGFLTAEAARLSRAEAETHTIYQLLRDSLGIQVVRADIGIRALKADRNAGKLLGLAPGSPVLVMERVSFTKAGAPVEHSFFYVAPEAYEFRLNVPGPLQISSGIKQFDHDRTRGVDQARAAASRRAGAVSEA